MITRFRQNKFMFPRYAVHSTFPPGEIVLANLLRSSVHVHVIFTLATLQFLKKLCTINEEKEKRERERGREGERERE